MKFFRKDDRSLEPGNRRGGDLLRHAEPCKPLHHSVSQCKRFVFVLREHELFSTIHTHTCSSACVFAPLRGARAREIHTTEKRPSAEEGGMGIAKLRACGRKPWIRSDASGARGHLILVNLPRQALARSMAVMRMSQTLRFLVNRS